MGYKLIGKNRLIPRVDIQGRRRVYVKSESSDSNFDNEDLEISILDFIIQDCSVQPTTGRSVRDYTMKLQMEGMLDHDSYMVYSGTMLQDSKQGTGILPDQILLSDNNGVERWFTVLKSDKYITSGVERYQSFVVAAPEE